MTKLLFMFMFFCHDVTCCLKMPLWIYLNTEQQTHLQKLMTVPERQPLDKPKANLASTYKI